MRFAAIGDQFVRHEVMVNAIEEYFENAEVNGYSTGWPLDISQSVFKGPEVSECDGTEDDVIALAKDADYLVLDIAPITKRVFDACPNLKAIAVTRGGAVNVNVDEATSRGIPVFNSPGRNLSAVGEFTVALTLAHLKNIPMANRDLKQGVWRGDLYSYEKVGQEMSELVVGIVGFGNIGRQTSKLFSCFGSDVLVYDPFVSDDDIQNAGYTPVSLDELFAKADVVTLHAKVTPENVHMVGAREIGMMKPSAILVNTARAELIDMDALYDALVEKRIGGACLDVFEKEPIGKSSRYLPLENLTVTPHIGGASQATVRRAISRALIDLKDYIEGREPKYCLNPEVLKK